MGSLIVDVCVYRQRYSASMLRFATNPVIVGLPDLMWSVSYAAAFRPASVRFPIARRLIVVIRTVPELQPVIARELVDGPGRS